MPTVRMRFGQVAGLARTLSNIDTVQADQVCRKQASKHRDLSKEAQQSGNMKTNVLVARAFMQAVCRQFGQVANLARTLSTDRVQADQVCRATKQASKFSKLAHNCRNIA